ncbi:hypothetical protein PV326_010370, partial [Microctonus aethiopoides]
EQPSSHTRGARFYVLETDFRRFGTRLATLHEVRINKLEKHDESISLQVTTLCNNNQKFAADLKQHIEEHNNSLTSISSEVIIAGIPQALSHNILTAIAKVLQSIEAKHLFQISSNCGSRHQQKTAPWSTVNQAVIWR